jgi:hypothetical protein
MPFCTRQERDLVKPQIKFGNMDTFLKSETNFLCTHISVYMKWDEHARSLISKLSKFCYMIKFLKYVIILLRVSKFVSLLHIKYQHAFFVNETVNPYKFTYSCLFRSENHEPANKLHMFYLKRTLCNFVQRKKNVRLQPLIEYNHTQ